MQDLPVEKQGPVAYELAPLLSQEKCKLKKDRLKPCREKHMQAPLEKFWRALSGAPKATVPDSSRLKAAALWVRLRYFIVNGVFLT